MSIFSIGIDPKDDFFFQDSDGLPDGIPGGTPVTITVSFDRLLENDGIFASGALVDIDFGSAPLPSGFFVDDVNQTVSFTGGVGSIDYDITQFGSVIGSATATFAVSDRTVVNEPGNPVPGTFNSGDAPLDGIVHIRPIIDGIDGLLSLRDYRGEGTGFYFGERTVATNAHVLTEGAAINASRLDIIVSEDANRNNIQSNDRVAFSTSSFISPEYLVDQQVSTDFATISLGGPPTSATVFGLEVYIDFEPEDIPLIAGGVFVATAGYPGNRSDSVEIANIPVSFTPQMVLSSGTIEAAFSDPSGVFFSSSANPGADNSTLDASGGQSGSPVFVTDTNPRDGSVIHRAVGLLSQGSINEINGVKEPSYEFSLITPISVGLFETAMSILEATGDVQPDYVWNKLVGSDGDNIIPGGPGNDIRIGGGGSDTFTGRVQDFDGDIIEDFGTDDIIQIQLDDGTNATLNLGALTAVADNDPNTLDTVSINLDGRGAPDATFQTYLPPGFSSFGAIDAPQAIQSVLLPGETIQSNFANFRLVEDRLGYGFSTDGIQFLGVDGFVTGTNLGSPQTVVRGSEIRNIAVTDTGRIFSVAEIEAGENDIIGIPPIFFDTRELVLLEHDPLNGSIIDVTELQEDFGVNFTEAVRALAPLPGGGFFAIGEFFIGSNDTGQDFFFRINTNGTTDFIRNVSSNAGDTIDGPTTRFVSADTGPDGQVYAWQDFQNSYGGGSLWRIDPSTGNATSIASFGQGFEIIAISFAPDGTLLATGGDTFGRVSVFEVDIATSTLSQVTLFHGSIGFAQEFEAIANLPPQIDNAGTPGDDLFQASPSGSNFSGGPGNDIIVAGAGSDRFTGGAGFNTFAGTLANFSGDVITDFSLGDSILLLGSAFGLPSLSVTFGSAILDIDADLDGTVDSTITLEGDFDPLTTAFDVQVNSLGNTTIQLVPTNLAPTAVDDAFSLNEDASLTFSANDLLANDSDPEVGDTLSIVSFYTEGLLGNISENTDGTFTFTPDPVLNGLGSGDNISLSFSYTISDGNGGSDTGLVQLDISGSDDPEANDDLFNVAPSSTIEISANDLTDNDVNTPGGRDLDVVGLDTSQTVGALSLNASGNLEYTAASGFLGTDVFSYTVSDGNGGTDTATVSVTVSAAPNQAPVVSAITAGFGEDATSRTVNLLDPAFVSDPDGDDLDVENVVVTTEDGRVLSASTDPETGLFSLDDGQFEDLADGVPFDVTIDYDVTDGIAATANTATVTITGNADAPVAVNDTASVAEDGSVDVAVLLNDTDVDSTVLQIKNIGMPTNGTATVNGTVISYTPDPDFFGHRQLHLQH